MEDYLNSQNIKPHLVITYLAPVSANGKSYPANLEIYVTDEGFLGWARYKIDHTAINISPIKRSSMTPDLIADIIKRTSGMPQGTSTAAIAKENKNLVDIVLQSARDFEIPTN